ncbi:Uncharacterised protein [Porphyromonas macacae]|uniref:Uncharacterized protein n=1 Tax=Porphyromonas macacae TaxID=28115 RepID=A0A379E8V6_9PORP|nr:DUF4494 domain-containing protein [Porphyromonas macacae]SUB89123.1 Uncharacterised protein [Porphyromonas macacae]
MNSWFECKVTYEKISESGSPKKISESYLVDALSFTEAEERITREISPFVSMGEFTVSNIKRAKIAELFLDPSELADRYFRCKVLFVTLDEKSGTEKKAPAIMFVKAASLSDAVKKLSEEMDKTLATYEIANVADTSIMDIFPYESGK